MFNCKLVTRDKYSETIIDLIVLASSIKVGDISSDIEIVEGSKLQAGVLGSGTVNVGREMSFGIPIAERKENGKWLRLEDQYATLL